MKTITLLAVLIAAIIYLYKSYREWNKMLTYEQITVSRISEDRILHVKNYMKNLGFREISEPVKMKDGYMIVFIEKL